ncbi:hypothetical protein V1507DRAFT_446547, partial [Lipomyces tetrasporus]
GPFPPPLFCLILYNTSHPYFYLLLNTSHPSNMQQIMPFWNEISARISRQLWLPPASIPPGEWKELGRGWGTCRTWSSGAEVHPEFKLPLDGLEEGDQDQHG